MDLFQSTSVIADGRIREQSRRQPLKDRFNPRPSLLTDESPGQPGLVGHLRLFQSTSVIADGRIDGGKPSPACLPSFNPRPSLLTDESLASLPDLHPQARFNPRPSLLTDESVPLLARRVVTKSFQSTSVIADGRIPRRPGCRRHGSSCFNPRPSLLTDESLLGGAVAGGQGVSIHVRHC